MIEQLQGKRAEVSKITLSQIMQPSQANASGNVHGGWIMKLIDEAGGLACVRHAQNRVVTVVVDQLTFKHPIKIGDLVILEAELSYVGNTSMETEVNVYAENPITCERWHTNTAYFVYVALDDTGRPTKVPPLIVETKDEKQRFEEGKARQGYRLEQAQKTVDKKSL